VLVHTCFSSFVAPAARVSSLFCGVICSVLQAQTLKPYTNAIRATLNAALCLENFASQVVERHNKPEVESRQSKEVLLNAVTIARTKLERDRDGREKQEKVLIEPSINSVRISISLKKSDELEFLLAKIFMSFLQQRAEHFLVLRRKPIKVRTRTRARAHAVC
jgi:hypothetical protein